MPLRRPVSPLELEVCPQTEPDHDDFALAASDDDLDESQLSARRRRIEKLGKAYLKGAPLFILSASLRGPLGKDWVNPWKKDRRKLNNKQRSNDLEEQPVIPETNSRKRRRHQDRSVTSPSKSSDSSRKLSRADFIRHDSRDQAHALAPTAADSQSPSSIRHKPTDAKWLKKDKVSTRFQHIDPPTSPTTSISSRYSKKGEASSSHATSRPGTAGHDSAQFSKVQQAEQSKQQKQIDKSPRQRLGTPGSSLQKDASQLEAGDRSVHVVSSSSQLPKFEYRLKHGKPPANEGCQPDSKPEKDDLDEENASGSNEIPHIEAEGHPSKSPSVFNTEPDEIVGNAQQGTENFVNLTNASNIIDNSLSVSLNKDRTTNSKYDTISENNLPSAQPAPRNPGVSDNLTSLYSITASKATSNRTEEHYADPQFSTQAALMMAQRSFQNDLTSPECSPVMARKRRASQGFNHHSPNAVNITPFHKMKMNTPERDVTSRLGASGTERAQMISTQYIIDAATPFTFSTEKKAEFRTLSSDREKSKNKKRKTTSFAQSSPSEIPSEHFTSDDQDTAHISEGLLAETEAASPNSHQTAFPMTLTGTTPPTAQEGQAVETFNLSQAIAEAGSWLQQSFDINKDINHCRNANLPQPHPTDSAI